MKLRELMNICHQNLLHAQELQKQVHYKRVKSCNYALDEKIWLNNKHIKTKQNQKLKVKFFEPFGMLHPIEKQIYKLKLPEK